MDDLRRLGEGIERGGRQIRPLRVPPQARTLCRCHIVEHTQAGLVEWDGLEEPRLHDSVELIE